MPPASRAGQRRAVDERADADPREQCQPHPARHQGLSWPRWGRVALAVLACSAAAGASARCVSGFRVKAHDARRPALCSNVATL